MPAPRGDKWEQDIERRLAQLEQRRPFSGTPIRPQADGSVQSDDFDGDLATDNAGTKGWALSSLKAAFGELILRPGSIGNDALTNPVAASVLNDFQSNFAVTPMDFGANTVPTIITSTISAPEGFTQALVTATTWGTAVNPNTSGGVDGTGTDYLLCRTWIDGAFSQAFPTGVSGSNGQATASSGLAAVVDASGGSFQIKTQLGSAVAGFGAANTSNGARVAASIVWLR